MQGSDSNSSLVQVLSPTVMSPDNFTSSSDVVEVTWASASILSFLLLLLRDFFSGLGCS